MTRFVNAVFVPPFKQAWWPLYARSFYMALAILGLLVFMVGLQISLSEIFNYGRPLPQPGTTAMAAIDLKAWGGIGVAILGKLCVLLALRGTVKSVGRGRIHPNK